MSPAAGAPGPPPLAPFGLVLHHDGRFSHEGQPIRNRRLREHFERSVRYLSEEGVYVVTLRHFRAQLVVEEAGFFVRDVDLAAGSVTLSDGSREPLEVASLRPSPRDGALLCTVKRRSCPEGLPARFTHAAQAELYAAALEEAGQLGLRIAGRFEPFPAL